MIQNLPFKLNAKSEKEKWRAETFRTKEPETLEWIKTFKQGSTLLDVGANIGIYSLYAASLGYKVVAVEPQPENFRALCLNIALNDFENITPVPFVVSDLRRLTHFHYPSMEAGATGGTLENEEVSNQFATKIFVQTVDFLCEIYDDSINHIKIDVDGSEGKIVQGMSRVLKKKSFESCLIEVDPINRLDVLYAFESNGYHQNSGLNRLSNHSRNRRRKEGIHVENIIFMRAA